MEDKSEIFSQRLIQAVMWNIGLQTVLAIVLVFVIQVDFLHPLSWFASTLNDILSWKMALNVFLLGLVSFFQAYIYGSYYTKPMPKRFTRFSMFLSIFSIQNMIFSILYALNGYFTMSLYSSLAKSNFTELKKECNNHDDVQCFAEQSLFLQFGGMWMGLYYFLNVYIFGSAVLTFPHVYQDKFQQIKLATSHVLSQGFRNSMAPVAYYSIFYYFWGYKPRSIVGDVYNLYLEDPPLDSIYNLISSGIWIGLWFYTSLFFVSVYTMRTVFNIILTEPMKFPIESNTTMNLCNALSQKTQFTSYLGALDLKMMSMTDPMRRSQIYMLSQPGGHPRNWTNLLEKCLSILNNFSKELEVINGDNSSADSDRIYAKSKLNVTPPVFNPGTLRNMAQSPYLQEFRDQNKDKIETTFVDVLKDDFNNFLNKLCQKPGINYFFGELTDTRLKFVLIQAQPVMWICEGLAHITASSLKEDKYGTVQNDLPVVILALVNLKQNLDKLTKPGLVPRKHILNDVLAIKIKSALMSSVKRSLYNIVLTFSKYVNEIPLDADIQAAIQPFLSCKEP